MAFSTPGLPSHNNHLEGKIRDVKQNGTLWLREAVTTTSPRLFHYLQSESQHDSRWNLQPEIPSVIWGRAQDLAKTDVKETTLKYSVGSVETQLFIPSASYLEKAMFTFKTADEVRLAVKGQQSIFAALVGGITSPSVSSGPAARFEEYMDNAQSMYTLKRRQPQQAGDVKFDCTCPSYFEAAFCKHVLGVGRLC